MNDSGHHYNLLVKLREAKLCISCSRAYWKSENTANNINDETSFILYCFTTSAVKKSKSFYLPAEGTLIEPWKASAGVSCASAALILLWTVALSPGNNYPSCLVCNQWNGLRYTSCACSGSAGQWAVLLCFFFFAPCLWTYCRWHPIFTKKTIVFLIVSNAFFFLFVLADK